MPDSPSTLTMRRVRGAGCSATVFAVLSILTSCSDATRPPASGSLRITAVTVGDDPDPNGYVVTVDSGTRYVVGTRSTVDISDIVPGDHTVYLDDTSTNCTVQGEPEQRVNVVIGRPALVSFSVACVPRVGSVAVSTVTTGVDLQTRSYTIAVNAERGNPIGLNDATTLTGIREGIQSVWLRDVADNCAVDGSNPQRVAVSFDQPATAVFAVTCVSSQATLQITTVTTGADPDAGGYTARIAWGDDTTTAQLPTDGTASVVVTAHKGYDVSLVGVAVNCNVDEQDWPGSRRRVDIAPGGTTAISVAIACEAMPHDRLPPGGQLAFVRDGRIYRVNSDGSGLVRLTDGPSDAQPSWSPDGHRIAFTRQAGTSFRSDVYIMDSDGSNTVRRLAGVATVGAGPTWSPDGKHIAFDCLPNTGSVEICVISADGDGTGANVIERAGYDGAPAWSPDGSRIAFVSDWTFFDFALDIFVMAPDGSSVTQLTDGAPGDVGFVDPNWSPDGRTLAVVSRFPLWSDAASTTKLLLLNADGSGGRTLATPRVPSGPAWSPDGRTIAFATRFGIEWISADGSHGGLIVLEGGSPSWRP